MPWRWRVLFPICFIIIFLFPEGMMNDLFFQKRGVLCDTVFSNVIHVLTRWIFTNLCTNNVLRWSHFLASVPHPSQRGMLVCPASHPKWEVFTRVWCLRLVFCMCIFVHDCLRCMYGLMLFACFPNFIININLYCPKQITILCEKQPYKGYYRTTEHEALDNERWWEAFLCRNRLKSISLIQGIEISSFTFSLQLRLFYIQILDDDVGTILYHTIVPQLAL